MALPPGHPKKQHYVPNFYLRNFADNKQIWEFNKSDDFIRRTSTAKVAVEPWFYDFQDQNGEEQSLEYDLGKIENESAPIIAKIIKTESLDWISDKEKQALAFFVSIMQLRVKISQYHIKNLNDDLRKKLVERGTDPEMVLPEIDDETARLAVLDHLKLAREFSPIILNKKWILQKAPSGNFIYTSDNPVVLNNNFKNGSNPNLGLEQLGIEILLPISPQLSLLMLCEKTFGAFENKLNQIRQQNRQLRAVPLTESPLKEIVESGLTGQPWHSPIETVTFLNCLQVNYSAEFLFSLTDDFSLAKKMINEHPHLKNPPRMVMP